MVNSSEKRDNMSFEESLKSMTEEDLKRKKVELAGEESEESNAHLQLVLKELMERGKNKGEEDSDESLEARTIALNDDIQKIADEFREKRKNLKKRDNKYQELLDQESEEIKKKIQEFASTDVRTYEGKSKSLEQRKDDEINNLKALLDEKPNLKNVISDTLSPSSIKLQNVDKHIQKLKGDKDHYPENMLSYLSRVSTSLFMTPFQRIKGGWNSISKIWSSDEDLGKRFDAIKELLEEKSSDSNWRKRLKAKMRDELLAAQNQYVENANNRAKKQVGLAA